MYISLYVEALWIIEIHQLIEDLGIKCFLHAYLIVQAQSSVWEGKKRGGGVIFLKLLKFCIAPFVQYAKLWGSTARSSSVVRAEYKYRIMIYFATRRSWVWALLVSWPRQTEDLKIASENAQQLEAFGYDTNWKRRSRRCHDSRWHANEAAKPRSKFVEHDLQLVSSQYEWKNLDMTYNKET